MTGSDPSDQLQYLAGEVDALRVVLMALVDAHEKPEFLLRQLERLTELQAGLTGPMPVTESFLAGQSETTHSFRDRLAESLSRRSL